MAYRQCQFRERAAANILPMVSLIPSVGYRPAAPPIIAPSSTSAATSSSYFNFGDHWATSKAHGDLAMITWGSLTGAVREAAHARRRMGSTSAVVAPRLLSPVQPERLAAALEGVERILVVEQTHGAQFHRYLRAHYDLPAPVRVLHRPGPLPITAGEIHQAIAEWRSMMSTAGPQLACKPR